MRMKRARIIYNPTSGREAFKKHLPEVLEKLEIAGYETSCHATTCEGDATKAAIEAVRREFDIVIAVGGDGTLNEVVAGISQCENRPKLGLIPMGTTNDFARAMHIPRKVEEALDIILAEETFRRTTYRLHKNRRRAEGKGMCFIRSCMGREQVCRRQDILQLAHRLLQKSRQEIWIGTWR